jgi:hypothetical protein
VTALCVWLGFYTTFNSFGGWDDEGYLLNTLSTFTDHGGLYTHIQSTFGPLYFEAFSTIFTWLPVTHDDGRIVTLVVTVLTSLGFGVATKMFTRNLIAGIATQVGTFVLLIFSFVDESMHPSILVWFLIALVLIALALISRGQRTFGSVMLGAAVAALVLTEVNVGALAAIAMLFAGLMLASPLREMRLPRIAAAVLFVGTPALLIVVGAGHISESWALKYALIVTLAAAGVAVLTLDKDLHGLVHRRDLHRFLLGGGIVGALVIVIALLSGTQLLDLVRGVLIDPARYSSNFTIPLVLPWWVEAWGAGCLAGAVVYRRYRHRSSSSGLLDACVHVIAGSVMLYIAVAQAQLQPSVSFSVSFTVALPLLFFAAIPPVGATESQRIARVGLVALAVLEGLVAYPVAGAQIRWSSLLIVPAGMLCLNDGLSQLRAPAIGPRRHGRHISSLLASVVLFAGLLAWLAWIFAGNLSTESSSYRANTRLTLAGSDMIRLPAGQADTLELLSRAIRAQCSTFVTLPALDSLYLWTGERPPTGGNGTWFYSLDARQQKQIVDRIEGRDGSRFCVVDNPFWTSFWTQGHVLPQLPLARLVERSRREYSPPQVFNGYRLFVARGVVP